MKSAIFAMLLAAGSAQAGELVVHAFSWHSKPQQVHVTHRVDANGSPYTVRTEVAFNNFNPGLGYRWDNGWQTGYYVNSYSEPSWYLVKEWKFTERFGVMLGFAANGYKQETRSGAMPLAGLTFRQPLTERVALGVQVAPAIGNRTAVVHTTLYYSLHK